MTHSTSPATSEQRAAAVRLVDANALAAQVKLVLEAVESDSANSVIRRGVYEALLDWINTAPSIVATETPTIAEEMFNAAIGVLNLLKAMGAPAVPDTSSWRLAQAVGKYSRARVATPAIEATPHAELIRQLDAANTEGEVVRLATRELHMAAIENEDVRAAFDRARERANRASEAAKKADEVTK